jgi:hypothetical protein
VTTIVTASAGEGASVGGGSPEYTIIDKTTAGIVAGTFTGLAEGDTFEEGVSLCGTSTQFFLVEVPIPLLSKRKHLIPGNSTI